MNVSMPESRKLTGLLITLGALLVLCVIAVVAVAVFGVGESLFAQIGGFISALGATHQGAQAAADRSPNYPNVAPAPWSPPIGGTIETTAPGGTPGLRL